MSRKIWIASLVVLTLSMVMAPFAAWDLAWLTRPAGHQSVPPARRAHAAARTVPSAALTVRRASAGGRAEARRRAALFVRPVSAQSLLAAATRRQFHAVASPGERPPAFASILRL